MSNSTPHNHHNQPMKKETYHCDLCGKELPQGKQDSPFRMPFCPQFVGIRIKIEPSFLGDYGKKIFGEADLCGQECFERFVLARVQPPTTTLAPFGH